MHLDQINNRLILGSLNLGIIEMNLDSGYEISAFNSPKFNKIKCFIKDKDLGIIYFGTYYDGLYGIDINTGEDIKI